MPYTRKFQGKGLLASSNTTIYEPAGSSNGIVGMLAFFNESTSLPAKVTIYAPHTGTPDRVLDEVTLNPRRSYVCRPMINQVIQSGYDLSAVADVASIVSYTCSGAEE